MVLVDGFVDFYPLDGTSQMPIATAHHHYPRCHAIPQTKTDTDMPREPFRPDLLPCGGNCGNPSTYHGCCTHCSFPGSHPQPFSPCNCYGGYRQVPEPYHVQIRPEIYPIDLPVYGHDDNLSGNVEWVKSSNYGDKHVDVRKQKPEVKEKNGEVKHYPYPDMLFPNGYLKNKRRMKAYELNVKKLDEVPLEKISQYITDGNRIQLPYPIIWWPYDDGQEKAEASNPYKSNEKAESVVEKANQNADVGTNMSDEELVREAFRALESACHSFSARTLDLWKALKEKADMRERMADVGHLMHYLLQETVTRLVRNFNNVKGYMMKLGSHKHDGADRETEKTLNEEEKIGEVMGVEETNNVKDEAAIADLQSVYRGNLRKRRICLHRNMCYF